MVGEYYLAPLPEKGGRITAESVAECSWNQWQDHSGISGRMLAEYAVRRGLGHNRGGDVSAGARTVVDDDALAEAPAQRLCEQSRQQVASRGTKGTGVDLNFINKEIDSGTEVRSEKRERRCREASFSTAGFGAIVTLCESGVSRTGAGRRPCATASLRQWL